MSSRKIVDGINWVAGLKGKGDEIAPMVEKGKSTFVGPEIQGKKLGVIGLGAIGAMVASAATHLGMEVYGYDPFITVDSAWHLSRSVHKAADKKEIYEKCDYITYHVPLNPDTKGSINAEAIAMMKDGVRLLNFSRGEIANYDDLAAALESGKVAGYVTDFPNEKVLAMKNVTAIPHLAASTPESEDNCAVMAVNEISEYICNGNIINSVNLPSVSCERTAGSRICVIHKNVPNVISQVSDILGKNNINIETITSKSRGDVSYAIIDTSEKTEEAKVSALSAIEDVIKVRFID